MYLSSHTYIHTSNTLGWPQTRTTLSLRTPVKVRTRSNGIGRSAPDMLGQKRSAKNGWLGPGWIVIVSILSPRLLALPDCAQSRVNRAILLRAVCFRGEFLYGVGVFASKRGVASVAKGPFGSRTDAFQPLRVPFERRVSARQDDSRGRVRSCVFRRVHQGREGV